MSDHLLSVNALTAFYGDFQALFGVDMRIRRNEVVAIIGANGAGKSTLLRSVAGLQKNQANQIVFNDSEIGAMRADQIAHLGIALVPEGRHLFPSMSVEENLKLGSRVRRTGHWSLETVYQLFPVLKERRHMPSTSLSGGQQQMVAISRALMANPELILFDEISLGLAPVIIQDIYNVLPDIIEQGMTAIIVEQDISRAMAVASRFYCLQEGHVSLEGSTDKATHEQITAAYFGVAV
jgi:branched-chain amino acid transport system ATP-binding protein